MAERALRMREAPGSKPGVSTYVLFVDMELCCNSFSQNTSKILFSLEVTPMFHFFVKK